VHRHTLYLHTQFLTIQLHVTKSKGLKVLKLVKQSQQALVAELSLTI